MGLWIGGWMGGCNRALVGRWTVRWCWWGVTLKCVKDSFSRKGLLFAKRTFNFAKRTFIMTKTIH